MNIIKHITLTLLISLPVIALTQNDSKYGDTPEQQTLCKEALSVYKSYKKQKNYREAYQQWEKACAVCPETVQESLYADGATFIKAEIKAATKEGDEVRASVLVDSLMWAYDMRMKHFPATKKKPNNRCHVLGRKASDQYKYFKDQPEIAYSMFKESLDCIESKSSASTLSGYYASSFYTMKAVNKVDKEKGNEMKTQMLTDYLRLMEYANDAIVAANGKEKTIKGYQSAKENIEKIFTTIAKCDEMVPVLQANVDANPDDLELKRKVLSLLVNRECTENDLFLPVATAVYEFEPSAEAAYAIGMGYAKKEKFSDSFKYMEEAVMNCDSCTEQLTYLLKTGQIASALNRPNTAKRYARQVLAIDPGNADAYMLIGDAIAGSPKACDDGALGTRAIYWVAHDYYSKAKRLNPDLSKTAETKMRNMEKQFPTIDDVFTLGLSAGASFTVKASGSCPCSGETTTIRVR
tara:strand:- start:7 stop:1401 length:1395 start_codon:yes stop_codon:yes gene_type:complete